MNTAYWTAHFRQNQINRPEPDWSLPMKLNGKPLRLLRKSLQQFQLGDGGGPASLIGWDRERMLGQSNEMRELVDLWFKEEAEHSRLLGEALKRFGVDPIESHWSFSMFCGVRKWGGVGFELYALLLTEIVSHVYYKLLRRHFPDEALRQMCQLIIRDEAGHIAFHRARLAAEGKRYGPFWSGWFRLRGLAAGTVLWLNHGAALRSVGATNGEFYRAIWRGMSAFVRGLRRDAGSARRDSGESPGARFTPGRHRGKGNAVADESCRGLCMKSPCPKVRPLG